MQWFTGGKKCAFKRSIVDTLVLGAILMNTVGIYARVSTDKQENGNQLDQLRE
jgi:hypothetical protein